MASAHCSQFMYYCTRLFDLARRYRQLGPTSSGSGQAGAVAQLLIAAASAQDAGEYTCQASNSHGAAARLALSLSVLGTGTSASAASACHCASATAPYARCPVVLDGHCEREPATASLALSSYLIANQ